MLLFTSENVLKLQTNSFTNQSACSMTFYKRTLTKRRRVQEVNLQISCKIRQGAVRQSEETSKRTNDKKQSMSNIAMF